MKYKAIKICGVTKTITEVEIDDTLDSVHKHLHEKCEFFDVARFWEDTGDTLYIDDDRIYRDSTCGFFMEGVWYDGNGMMVGISSLTGNWTHVDMLMEDVVKMVTFLDDHQFAKIEEEIE